VVASRTPRAQVQALVRIGSPLLWRLVTISAIAGFVAMAAGVLGGRSLRRLVRGAARIARGETTQGPTAVRRVARSRVAEVAAVAEAVEGMALRLRTRLDGAQAFAGHAAHELRTPIATLRGTLELLQDDATMPAAQRERFLQNGAAELDRLDGLVGSLLDLGRGDRLVDPDPVDLDAIVHDAARAFGVPCRGHAARILGHAASLRVVADNLLSNARRHGGPQVRVVAFADDDEVGFEVHDDGPGLPADVQARLFDRFFTTDRSRGVGLGLAVVDQVVAAHGGTVTVRADPGATCFRVALPGRA
jgi:signal transduction histidine kinase